MTHASPVKRSFTFTTPFDEWEITLVQAITTLNSARSPFERKVRELFRTETGRLRLCTEVLHEDDSL